MPGCLSQSQEDALGATCGNFQSLKINIYPSFRNEVSAVNIPRQMNGVDFIAGTVNSAVMS